MEKKEKNLSSSVFQNINTSLAVPLVKKVCMHRQRDRQYCSLQVRPSVGRQTP